MMLRLLFLPEEQGNILFCIFQLEQFRLGFPVLLIDWAFSEARAQYSASSLFGLDRLVMLFALR
mgnify:CR=1 FL=1